MRTQQDLEVAQLKKRWSGALWALRIFTLLAYAANMVINYLSNTGYFGGGTIGQVSAKYPTILTPAGYAFSIWGLIFTLQGFYTVYGLLPFDDDKLRYIALLNVFVPLGWIGEALWVPIFTMEYIPFTVFFITGSCLFFMTAYIRVTAPENRLGVSDALLDLLSGESPAYSTAFVIKKAFYYTIFVLPNALNFGWLVVASIVNVLIELNYLGIGVPVPVAIGFLAFANLIALFFLAWRRDIVVSLVQVWAITAISIKQSNVAIKSACYVSISVLVLFVLVSTVLSFISFVRERTRRRQNIQGGYQLTDIYYGAH